MPLLNCQMIDLTVTLSRPANSIDELLAPLRAAAASRLSGVLCVIDQELVSSDFLGFPQSTIIDAPATIMLSPTVFKVSPFSFRPASPRPRSFARIDSQGGGEIAGEHAKRAGFCRAQNLPEEAVPAGDKWTADPHIDLVPSSYRDTFVSDYCLLRQ